MNDAADLVAAFEQGRVHGVRLAGPRIDTHLSHVFLTGTRAYKLKRPVKFPFVDFSSVDRRRRACEAELEVNRRMGSRLYLGVHPVVRDGSGYRVGGEGPALDWVVEMRRFDQSQQFDELARAGALSEDLVEACAECIADVHAALDPVTDPAAATDFEAVIDALRETDADGERRHGLAAADDSLFDRLHDARRRLARMIEDRRVGGRVRRCHGDLHLRNICLFEGRLTLFDALEFDDRLATIDVLYDLAFLLMDLRHAGAPGLANRAMNRYWDRACEDEAALALLPMFTALRATVRMAVAAEAGRAREAGDYGRLADALLRPAAPSVVAVGGLSGVGKSAVARRLAARLAGPAGARVLRTDVLRKQGGAGGPGGAGSAPAPPAAYTPEARLGVYETLGAHARSALAAGAVVVADATFQDAAARAAIARIDARFSGVWLDAPLEVRLERIRGRHGDASDADASVAAAQRDPGALGPGWVRIDALGTIDEVVDRVVRVVGN